MTPRLTDGKRYVPSGARCIGINQMSPVREEALKFLKFLAGEKYCGLINEGADSMPGNQAYISLEHFENPAWPGEAEINDITIKSIPYARFPRRSLLIDYAVVERAFKRAWSSIVSNENLTETQIRHIMERAAREVDEVIARNIERNPKVARTYQLLLEQGAEPARLLTKGDAL